MDRQKKNIIELTRVSCDDYRRMEKLNPEQRTMRTLTGITGTPPHPEIAKTALGAENSVRWRHVPDAAAECRRLKAGGWRICALEQAHDSVPLDEFTPAPGEKYLLVAGNEVEGVSQAIVDMADAVLEIPQCGVKHSLNVSVSAGIAVWHLFSRLRLS